MIIKLKIQLLLKKSNKLFDELIIEIEGELEEYYEEVRKKMRGEKRKISFMSEDEIDAQIDHLRKTLNMKELIQDLLIKFKSDDRNKLELASTWDEYVSTIRKIQFLKEKHGTGNYDINEIEDDLKTPVNKREKLEKKLLSM